MPFALGIVQLSMALKTTAPQEISTGGFAGDEQLRHSEFHLFETARTGNKHLQWGSAVAES